MANWQVEDVHALLPASYIEPDQLADAYDALRQYAQAAFPERVGVPAAWRRVWWITFSTICHAFPHYATYDTIRSAIVGLSLDPGPSQNTIQVHLGQIRKRLPRHAVLRNVHNEGYRANDIAVQEYEKLRSEIPEIKPRLPGMSDRLSTFARALVDAYPNPIEDDEFTSRFAYDHRGVVFDHAKQLETLLNAPVMIAIEHTARTVKSGLRSVRLTSESWRALTKMIAEVEGVVYKPEL